MSPAEHLLAEADKLHGNDRATHIAEAQAHALLALAPNPPVIRVVNPR